jgi:hypothetical protein
MDATPEALNRSLQRSHRVVLGLIATCAIYSALQPQLAAEPAPDRRPATLAVVLALGTIVAKQIANRATASPRTRVTWTLCSYSLASAISGLGAFLATTRGAVQTGIVFSLAAGIFCLRPPARVEPSKPHGDPSGRGDPKRAA